MAEKNWQHMRGLDDILHRHDSSTPKHNRGRKRLRRSAKRKDARGVMREVDDLEKSAVEKEAEDDLRSRKIWLNDWSSETEYEDEDVRGYELDKYKVSDRPEIREALEKIASQMDTVSLSPEARQVLEDNLWDLV